MDKETAESKIRDLLVEVGKIVKEYGTVNYFHVAIFLNKGYISFNNRHWEGGEDENCPLNYFEFDADFSPKE